MNIDLDSDNIEQEMRTGLRKSFIDGIEAWEPPVGAPLGVRVPRFAVKVMGLSWVKNECNTRGLILEVVDG